MQKKIPQSYGESFKHTCEKPATDSALIQYNSHHQSTEFPGVILFGVGVGGCVCHV